VIDRTDLRGSMMEAERDVKEGEVIDRTDLRGSMMERGEGILVEEHQEDEAVDVVVTEVTEVEDPYPEGTETRTDTHENNFLGETYASDGQVGW